MNGWVDKYNRIFFKFNQKELSELIGVTPKTLRTHLTELEDFGLLFRKRLGLKQTDNLYLLQADYEENTDDFSVKKDVESVSYQLMGKNYPSRTVKTTHQEGENLPTNNIYSNKTDLNNIYKTTTTKKINTKNKDTESNPKSSSPIIINLDLKAITKTNISRYLKLNQEQIKLLEKYVLNSNYDNLDGFTYSIAKEIKAGTITKESLKASKSNKKTKTTANDKIKNFQEKDYDYDKLERELLGLEEIEDNSNDYVTEEEARRIKEELDRKLQESRNKSVLES